MNPIAEKIKTMKQNTLIHIVYDREWNNTENDVITLFHGCENEYFMFGHPLRVSDDFMTAGGIGLLERDFKDLKTVTKEEYVRWLKKYEEFHMEIMEEKGYDFCEEKLNNVTLYVDEV